ncbi:hypothetical protein C8R44DRAFT_892815 [Mycena epipterygia]|nr:hypothetical protein C8R44DRAFT_892815 [Mycena epipterygia]
MHPVFRAENLDKLPADLKASATAAAYGDHEALKVIYAHIASTPDAKNLLPVFHSGLDSFSGVLERLDSSSDADFEFFDKTISHALLCLVGLLHLHAHGSIPLAAASELWSSRVWPWIRLCDTYRDHLPRVPALAGERDRYDLFLAIILLFSKHPETAKLIDTTPGLGVVVVRAWSVMLLAEGIAAEDRFAGLCEFLLGCINLRDSRRFEEVIEGAGGSLASFASLVVKHINCVLNCASNAYLLTSVVALIGQLRQKCTIDKPFEKALLHHGIVAAVTRALCVFSEQPLSSHFDCCLSTIMFYVGPYGHNIVTEALRAGLLRGIFACGRRHCTPETRDYLDGTVIVLTGFLVYLSLLSQIETCITELESPVNEDSFKGFALNDRWKIFWSTLARRRFCSVPRPYWYTPTKPVPDPWYTDYAEWDGLDLWLDTSEKGKIKIHRLFKDVFDVPGVVESLSYLASDWTDHFAFTAGGRYYFYWEDKLVHFGGEFASKGDFARRHMYDRNVARMKRQARYEDDLVWVNWE